jgi:translation elongation factor P/translation initiation factor 5A
MTVTSGASLVVGQYIQINNEVMRVEEKDNVSIIVARGQYRTKEMKHSNGDVINLINAADHALIEVILTSSKILNSLVLVRALTNNGKL